MNTCVNHIKKNKETLLVASKEAGQGVNALEAEIRICPYLVYRMRGKVTV